MPVLSHRKREPAAGKVEAEAAFVLATAVLLDEGVPYADLSVEQIARKAGHSRSTFYFYFSDKCDLLLRATRHIDDRLHAAAAAWPSEPDGDGDVRDAVAGMFSIFREHPGLLCAVVEASGYDEQVREQWRELMDRFVAATEQGLLSQETLLANDGTAESGHARAFALVWMMERACYQHVRGGGVDDEQALIDALAEIWELSSGHAQRAARVDEDHQLRRRSARAANAAAARRPDR
jgi:AcrR family transcriptional regulator